MTSSTILTLLVVPVAFLWVERQRERIAKLWARISPDSGAAVHSEPDSAVESAGK